VRAEAETKGLELGLPGAGKRVIWIKLPKGGAARLLASPVTPNGHVKLALIGAVLWGFLRKSHTKPKSCFLVEAIGRRLVSQGVRHENPVTEVARLWKMPLLERGGNVNGRNSNRWGLAPWMNCRSSEVVRLFVTERLASLWQRKRDLFDEHRADQYPLTPAVKDILKRLHPLASLNDYDKDPQLRAFRKAPEKIGLTRDGEITTSFGRMPKEIRRRFGLDGFRGSEVDISSAHFALLHPLYTHEEQQGEEAMRYREALQTQSLYGPERIHKYELLASLNKHPTLLLDSEAYRTFRKAFPILAKRSEEKRWNQPKRLGRILRNATGQVMDATLKAASEDAIPVIPIHDGLAVFPPETQIAQACQLQDERADRNFAEEAVRARCELRIALAAASKVHEVAGVYPTVKLGDEKLVFKF